MFSSSFIPIDNTPRSNSPPPVKPIFTNKLKNGNGYVNGKRPLENDNDDNDNDEYEVKKQYKK